MKTIFLSALSVILFSRLSFAADSFDCSLRKDTVVLTQVEECTERDVETCTKTELRNKLVVQSEEVIKISQLHPPTLFKMIGYDQKGSILSFDFIEGRYEVKVSYFPTKFSFSQKMLGEFNPWMNRIDLDVQTGAATEPGNIVAFKVLCYPQ